MVLTRTIESSVAEADRMVLGTFCWLVGAVTMLLLLHLLLQHLLATGHFPTRRKASERTGLPGNLSPRWTDINEGRVKS